MMHPANDNQNIVQAVAAAMFSHWHAGLRGVDFHEAVRDEFPHVSLNIYNIAADLAFSTIKSGGGK